MELSLIQDSVKKHNRISKGVFLLDQNPGRENLQDPNLKLREHERNIEKMIRRN